MEKPQDEDEEIKSGPLLKKESRVAGKKWSEKWFVLTPRTLLWYNGKKDRASRKRPKGTISLEKVTIKGGRDAEGVSLGDSPNGLGCTFVICQSDGTNICLCASGEEDAGFWVDVLNSASAGRKDLTKETVAIQEELRKSGVHEISPEKLEFEESIIGAGASGIVKRGLWLKSTEVAVKVLKNVPEFTERRDLLSFYKEIETLSKLRHSNIVQMYGFCRKESFVCLVTEFVRGGNLADCLEDVDTYELDFYLQLELALSITRGMVYLHACGIIHRDLKPANILVESWDEAKVKVCDFGISKAIVRKKGQEKEAEALGSPQYAAPELSSESHDNKVDVFSFSIILWEIALRTMPWPEIKFGSQFAERYSKGERPEIPSDCRFKSLIEACWAPDPAKRPSFSGVYEALENIKKGATSPDVKPPQRAKSALPLPSSGGLKTPAKGASGSSPNLNRYPSLNGSVGTGTMWSSQDDKPQYNAVLDRTGTLSPGKPGSGGPTSQPKTAAESDIWKLFTNGKNAVTWDEFERVFCNALQADMTQVRKIKFVFAKDEMVDRQTWDNFLVWFSPLCPSENTYQTTSGGNDIGGYEMRHIMEVCSPVHFHGFLSSNDAQKALKGKPDGTFLLRFSTTNMGCYALTVAYSNTVGHWRISCEKKAYANPLYYIDGREYKSLAEVIGTHQQGRGEPLNIKSPKPNQATSCYLGAPHPRPPDVEEPSNYYQNVRHG